MSWRKRWTEWSTPKNPPRPMGLAPRMQFAKLNTISVVCPRCAVSLQIDILSAFPQVKSTWTRLTMIQWSLVTVTMMIGIPIGTAPCCNDNFPNKTFHKILPIVSFFPGVTFSTVQGDYFDRSDPDEKPTIKEPGGYTKVFLYERNIDPCIL